MSIANPIFGIDVHPEYQKGFDFERAKAQGYEYAFIKASEGPYRDGTTYVPTGLKDFHARAQASGMIVGLYHFLLESDGDDPQRGGRIQADLFYRTIQSVGGTQGKLIAVDFEAYYDKYPWLWPTNETLKAFVSSLRTRIGNHPIVLYSVRSYWNETGTPSGDFDQYGADVAWDARYADMQPHNRPRDHYHELQDWGWGKPWGGVTPMFWQFTSSGLVSGQYIDVDAYRLTFKDLRSLAVTPLPDPDELEEEERNDLPNSADGVMENVRIAKQYGLNLLERRPKYWCWDGGNLNVPRPTVGRPACVDGPPPKMENIKRLFCADLISLQLRRLGKPVPKNRGSFGNFDGGTRSFRLRYGGQMKLFNLSECREGDVAFVDFQTSWAPEGHIGFCLGAGPDAKFLQSHLETNCVTGEPGMNNIYTLRESNMRTGGGNYYTHRIPRKVIWG
jgi:GH25 family lysozyme M1 (1,4-beta-N-acetylmuramidase)